MRTNRLSIHLIVLAFAFSSCEAKDRTVGGGGGDSCTTTDCMAECQDQGYAEGFCNEDDECICGSGDADTDSDSDSDADPSDECDVDILFVYDTSGSMMDAVGPLTDEAFPAFADALANYPELGDIHVAITNHLWGEQTMTPDGSGGTDVEVQTSYFLTEGWDPMQPHDSFWCEEIPSVDCGFASGERWMEGPSSTLLDEFACVGNVPCQQEVMIGEPTLEAGLKALQFDGNTGFLRDHALLVVVFITDEDDQSAMTPQGVRDGLLALKAMQDTPEDYVVAVTIAGPETAPFDCEDAWHNPVQCCDGTYGITLATPTIVGFTNLFGDHGLHYEMCGANNLSDALVQAFDILELSCDEIIIE